MRRRARKGTSEGIIEGEFHWSDWEEAQPSAAERPSPAPSLPSALRPGAPFDPGADVRARPARRAPPSPSRIAEVPDPFVASVPAGTATLDDLRELVRRTWGHDELRPLQAEAMQAALEGRDALVVLPTGGGKSLCYQAPALLRPGLTAVVSPLISLMKDQIDGLVSNGVPAAMWTSAQDGLERGRVHGALRDGGLKLLFVAPERLVMDGFLELLEEAGLSALAVDEAHCISHWGHDFRPEYRMLGELRRRRPDLPIQAFTATATPAVQRDVVGQLGLRDPAILVGDFDRPNLTYRFVPRRDLLAQVLAVVRRHPGEAGIVYCLRRRDVDKLAADLAREGVRCLPYHAGLDARARTLHQERFLNEEIDVVVATVAFGMGIDRTDVRYVVHASLPKGLEQFSQETGRAGRDGLPAECVLLHSGSDYHGWKNLMERSAAEGGSTADQEGALERLSEMMRFATGAVCRHRYLVEHFGQTWAPAGTTRSCGACDVCLGELAPVPDGTVLAQKILSGVVRCDQRYGASHVADVLRGADTERVRGAGHDRLTTHGLLKEHTARQIRGWIDQLVGLELLAVTPGPYPTLYLTQAGGRVLRGDAEATLFEVPRGPSGGGRRGTSPARLAADEGAPEPDAGLFEHLRGVRRRLARERGVPPYLIFGDRTLALMAAHRPATPEEFRALKGVGDKKAADLGPIFLEALAEYAGRDAGP